MRAPKLSSILSLGSILAVAVVAVAYLLFGVARVDWSERPTSAIMLIPDSANLVPRSPILLSGIRVGQVTKVTNTVDGVEVRFDIDEGRRIPVDSTVVIEALSALSEPYVEFRPNTGDGPYIGDGQLVNSHSVATPRSMPEVARTVTTLLQQLDPTAIASIIDTFGTALEGTDAVLPQLTHASDLLAATLLSRAPQIRALLDNAQVPGPDVAIAGADMAESGPVFAEFGDKVKEVVDSIQVLLDARPVPEAYTTGTGLIPFLHDVDAYLERVGPDLVALYPIIGPLLTKAGNVTQGIDLSALISQALASVSPTGAMQLEINVK
ncbi:MlaD family protein [Antrihabitans stalactiti]|uniref:MCE family protein n=1 Tax=Antrihabitans stalactiti TaxID=2584121 RepID=A0A848KEG4_9NOCA|nr:MlaD family protein [Antrihabitans stalactiti]NMN95524.1 MCE family protein [Antrihabitans stalactiti]